MFTLRGPMTTGGRPLSITWDNGRLTGAPVLVAEANRRAADMELVARTPTGPFVKADLISPEAALVTLASLFYSYEVEGDAPVLPEPAADTPVL